jgi:hypothetical protein
MIDALASSRPRVARCFFVTTYQNRKKYTKNRMATSYPKCPQNRPNGHKIYHHLHLRDTPKFTQMGILGLKKSHLATLSRLCGVMGREIETRRGICRVVALKQDPIHR